METIGASSTYRIRPIVVVEADALRLRGLLAAHRDSAIHDGTHLADLAFELERALLVTPHDVPSGVVVMDSDVEVLDLASGVRAEYTLVYPAHSDPSRGRISVLAPLGTAMLGYRKGDEIEWQMPGGVRRLRIEGVRSPHEHPVRH